MKIPKSSFSEYFKRSVVFLIKTKLAVFLTSIIEFVDLCTNVVDLTFQIFYYGKEYNYKDSHLSKILLAASPYQYFFNFITSDTTESFFTRNILFIVVYAVLFIWFLIYFLSIRNGDLDAMPTFNKIIPQKKHLTHNNQSSYMISQNIIDLADYLFAIDIKIGSNGQTFTMLIDTGSEIVWVPSKNTDFSRYKCK